MKAVGYFRPSDAPLSGNTWVYILEHESRATAEKNWAGFRTDPEWQKALKDTDANGRIIKGTNTFFMDPVDFSPLK